MSGRAKSRRLKTSRDELYFRDTLERELGDDVAKLLFADWLQERGDWRAAGYLWLAQHRKEPSRAASTWDWWHEDSTNRREIVLPDSLWQLLTPPPVERFQNCKEFATLRAAEEAICVAIATIETKGRAS